MKPQINKHIHFNFSYDRRGYGYLEMKNNITGADTIIQRWFARSGSCNFLGKLVNSIPPGPWYMISEPQIPPIEEYKKMKIEGLPGMAWKERLWPIPCPTNHDPISHYLIHPDGNKPGTAGCIGIQNSNAKELYSFFLSYFTSTQNAEILRIDIRDLTKPAPGPTRVSSGLNSVKTEKPDILTTKKGVAQVFKKDTLKTKSFWLGIATLGWGIYQAATGAGGTEEIIAGLGIIFGRDAVSKIK